MTTAFDAIIIGADRLGPRWRGDSPRQGWVSR
jgi:hypothetical protein